MRHTPFDIIVFIVLAVVIAGITTVTSPGNSPASHGQTGLAAAKTATPESHFLGDSLPAVLTDRREH